MMRTLAWLALTTLVGWLGWHSLQPDHRPTPPAPPPALTRQASPDEIEAITSQARRMEESLSGQGHPLATSDLESHLPFPMPDNPLVPGVGGVISVCPVDGPLPDGQLADWRHCPGTGEVRPVIPRG
jgi:hypothetical protein